MDKFESLFIKCEEADQSKVAKRLHNQLCKVIIGFLGSRQEMESSYDAAVKMGKYGAPNPDDLNDSIMLFNYANRCSLKYFYELRPCTVESVTPGDDRTVTGVVIIPIQKVSEAILSEVSGGLMDYHNFKSGDDDEIF